MNRPMPRVPAHTPAIPDRRALQDAFGSEPTRLENPSSTGVLLVGQKEMCQAVTELLKQQGVEQIHLNF